MLLNAELVILSRFEQETESLICLSYIHQEGFDEEIIESIDPFDVPSLKNCMKTGQHVQWTTNSEVSKEDLTYLSDVRKSNSILVLPLVVGGDFIGMVEILAVEALMYDLNEIRLARTISSQVAVALQNIQLFLKIRQGHNRLMSVLNSTKEGMLLTSPSGKIVVGNIRFKDFTGIDISEHVGEAITESKFNFRNALGYSDGEFDLLVDGFIGGTPVLTPRGTIVIEDEEPRIFDRSETLVRNQKGELIGWMVILRDITKEKEIEETREQLTEMIVHDLRSPLTTIVNSLTILERMDDPGFDKQIIDQAHRVSQRSVNQMLKLVDSLLDLRKLESKEIGLQYEDVSLQDMFAELLSSYIQEANDAGIILKCYCEPEIQSQWMDAGKIRRVFMNLLDNAISFTPSGGRVSMEAKLIDSQVAITVSDTGPGIPEEWRERIFERFFQVPGVRRRRRGTGLGLAFTKLTVEAHGGKIWVEDNQPQGTTFQLLFPNSTP
jgi:signal transduction histidine kinase